MADFSLRFIESSFLMLNGQKHFMSVAEDLTSNKQKRTERIYEKRRRHGHFTSTLWNTIECCRDTEDMKDEISSSLKASYIFRLIFLLNVLLLG